MIVVVATVVGIASARLAGGRLSRLAQLELRSIWVIWLAIVVQTVIFEVPGVPASASEVIHLGTYAAAFVFLWLNRHLPGAAIIGTGAACNAIAIAANGGVMPASESAWQRAGFADGGALDFENSNVVADANVAFLGDVFAIPAGWPLANVFSIGDVLIVLGATYLAHVWCHRPISSNATSVPQTSVTVVADVRIDPSTVGWTAQHIDRATMDAATAWLDDQLRACLQRSTGESEQPEQAA